MSSPESTVFVVDDELSVRQSLSRLLRATGLNVMAFDTIKVHRSRVMEKVKAASLAELVRIAQRAGIEPLYRESLCAKWTWTYSIQLMGLA